MVDSTQRIQRILAEANDPEVAVLLLDCVLGFVAAEDPAGDIAPAISEAKRTAEQRGDDLSVVVSVCGTELDDQGLEAQISVLKDAGAIVFTSAFQAAGFAVRLVTGKDRQMEQGTGIDRLLASPIAAINLGVEDFAENLEAQDAQVVHVNWTPPAGGDPEIIAILDKIL